MTTLAPPDVFLSPWSEQSIGLEIRTAGGSALPASGAWPATRRIVYVPFWLLRTDMVRKLWWLNGATASGNVDCGIYRNSAGLPTTKIVASGSVAQGTINVVQESDIADTRLDAGVYWMALMMDNATGTMFRVAPAQAAHVKFCNMFNETPGTFGLPATATPVAAVSAYIPMFGLAFRTLVA